MFMFKMYHVLVLTDDEDLLVKPACYTEMFCLIRDVHIHGTRQSLSFYHYKWNLVIMKRSIRIQGVIIWDKITRLVDIVCSQAVFKHKIKGLLNSNKI